MGKFMVWAAAALAMLSLASVSHAAGWSFTADAPLSYTFNNGALNQPHAGGGTANWKNRTTSDVSGSKVLLIAPFHVGLGYEDYSVAQNINIPNCGVGPCGGKVKTNLQMVDAVVDIPMHYLNLTLGYGSGQANVDIVAGNPPPLAIHHVNVTQTFVVIGIPLGMALDLHVGYHWVSAEKKDFLTGSSSNLPDQVLVSGEMLSAGARLNF